MIRDWLNDHTGDLVLAALTILGTVAILAVLAGWGQ